MFASFGSFHIYSPSHHCHRMRPAPAGSRNARDYCAHPVRQPCSIPPSSDSYTPWRGNRPTRRAAPRQPDQMDQLRRVGAGHMHPTTTPVFPMKEHLQEAAVAGIDRRRHLQQRDARRHEGQGRRCPSYSVAATRCAPCPSGRSTPTRALPFGRRLLRSLA